MVALVAVAAFAGLRRATESEVVWNFANGEWVVSDLGIAMPKANSATYIEEPITNQGITMTTYKSTNFPGFFLNSDGTETSLRVYKIKNESKGAIEFSVAEGTKLTKIVMNGDSKLLQLVADKGTIEMSNSNKTLTWTSEEGVQSVKFENNNASNTVRINDITFTKVTEEPVAQESWTVAGSNTDLFGTSWDPTATANDMTLVEGLYTWSKSDVTLPAGDVKFKVAKNHSWDESYPTEDYKLNIEKSGKYDVAITFNAESKEVIATATLKEEVEVDPVYVGVGVEELWGTAWDANNEANKLTKGDDGKFRITKEGLFLEVGEYGYKIVKDGSWIPDGTGNEQKLAIAEKGIYTVTLTVDPADDSYLAEAEKTASIMTIAEAQAAEAGTEVLIEGVVYASAATGAVIKDDTDVIYYYNKANALTIGQKVLVKGAVSVYGGANQLNSEAEITELGTVDGVVQPEAVEMKEADFTALAGVTTVERKYVTYQGTLSISNGKYFNISIGESTVMGSLVKPNEDLSELDGKTVVVKGYQMYTTTTNQGQQYVYTVATSVEAVPEPVAYSSSINIEQFVLENTVSAIDEFKAELTKCNIAYEYFEFDNNNTLDGLNEEKADRNEPFLGLKVKTQGATVKVTLEKGKVLNVKFGCINDPVNVTVDGEAAGEPIAANKAGGYIFTLQAADADREVAFTTTTAKAVIFKQIMIGEDIANVVLPPAPINVEDGYYLAGTMNNWKPTADDVFVENSEVPGEYMLTKELTAETEIKVVKIESKAISAWYPAEAGNYKVTADGKYDIYFRPAGNSDWENGFFYLAKNSSVEPGTVDVPADGDIAAAIAEAAAGDDVTTVTLNLAKDAKYAVTAPIATSKSIVINGNGATIDASGLTTASLFTYSAPTVPASAPHRATIKDAWATAPNPTIEINGVNVEKLAKPLFSYKESTLVRMNISVTDAKVEVTDNVFVFDIASSGACVENFSIDKSTFYATTATTNAFFSTQSAKKAKDVYDAIASTDILQTIKISNSTIYNFAKAKNFFTLAANNQTYLKFDVQNNIFVNCGKNGQVIKGINGGQNGKNPTWIVKGNAFNCDYDAQGAAIDRTDTSAAESTGDEAEPVQDSVAGIVTFTDAANGDFNGEFQLADGAVAPETLGAPAWTITFVPYVAPIEVDKLYIIGTGTASGWSGTTEVVFNETTQAFEYEANVTEDTYLAFGDAEFNPIDWDAFNNKHRYSLAATGNVEPTIGEAQQLVLGDSQACILLKTPGKYTLSVTKDLKLTVTATSTGINAVKAAHLKDAQIYTISGQRVEKAQKGLYIVNGKKVVIK